MPYAKAGDVKLYYESAGDGTPFVLHAHDHLSYMPFQVPYFSQFYRVIVFDRRGTGRSDDPPGPWTPADLAADVRNLMDALDIGKAIVGGTVPRLWPLGEAWLDKQIEAAKGNAPIIVNQPRSYEWEEDGPPTQAPGFAATQYGQYLASLSTRMGTPDALVKMLHVLKGWDQRPRYPEL